MSLKLYILHAHLDESRKITEEYSDEQGEIFHQHVSSLAERYKGQYNESMMTDYIWNLLLE